MKIILRASQKTVDITFPDDGTVFVFSWFFLPQMQSIVLIILSCKNDNDESIGENWEF